MSDCVLTCWLTLELTQKKRFRDFVNEVGTAVQSADAAFSSISCYVVDLPHMHEFLLGLATLTKVSGKAFTVLHDALRSLQGVESVGIYDDEIRAIRQQVPDGSFDDVYAEERR